LVSPEQVARCLSAQRGCSVLETKTQMATFPVGEVLRVLFVLGLAGAPDPPDDDSAEKDRAQRTEDSGQKTADRRQKTEERRQKTEDGRLSHRPTSQPGTQGRPARLVRAAYVQCRRWHDTGAAGAWLSINRDSGQAFTRPWSSGPCIGCFLPDGLGA
jgi:hypothetical protein